MDMQQAKKTIACVDDLPNDEIQALLSAIDLQEIGKILVDEFGEIEKKVLACTDAEARKNIVLDAFDNLYFRFNKINSPRFAMSVKGHGVPGREITGFGGCPSNKVAEVVS